MGLLLSILNKKKGCSFIQPVHALRSSRVVRDLQVTRAVLADACVCSLCRTASCCASAELPAELFLSFPCPVSRTFTATFQVRRTSGRYMICTGALTVI